MADQPEDSIDVPAGTHKIIQVDVSKMESEPTGDDPSGSGLNCYGNFGVDLIRVKKPGAGQAQAVYLVFEPINGGEAEIVDFRYIGWNDTTDQPADGYHWMRPSAGDEGNPYTGGGKPPSPPAWSYSTHGQEFRFLKKAAGGGIEIKDYGAGLFGPNVSYKYVLELKLDDGSYVVCDPEIKNQEE